MTAFYVLLEFKIFGFLRFMGRSLRSLKLPAAWLQTVHALLFGNVGGRW